AGEDGNAERGKKPGRHGAQLGARIFFAGGANVAVSGKLKARATTTGVAPGNYNAEGGLTDTGQGFNTAYRFFVEFDDLFRSFAVGNRGNIDGQDMPRVEAGLRRLHRKQRLEQHSCAREQQKGRRNLRNRENSQPPIRSSSDSHAAIGKA